ncbi:MAG: protein kinase [Myxococcaceae bacterium]|nr:protein kinase [Myxococcaceae bacterium]
MTSSPASSEVRLGPWRLRRLIARGGMGEVWEAESDSVPPRFAAVKVMRPNATAEQGSAGARQRFLDEGAIGARLRHPNIVRLEEVADQGEVQYLVMELLDGAPLSNLAAPEGLPLGVVLGCAVQALEGLDHAHTGVGEGHSVIHRDIKPSNLFLTRSGVLKVIDFGIARAESLEQTQTETGVVRGSLRYGCPEQLQGKSPSPQWDLFSLGVVLHELITGQPLFQRGTQAAVLSAILWTQAPRLDAMVPKAVADVVATALEKEPTQRYASARAMLDALVEAAGPGGVWPPERLASWFKSRAVPSGPRQVRPETASIRVQAPAVATPQAPEVTPITAPGNESPELTPTYIRPDSLRTAVDLPKPPLGAERTVMVPSLLSPSQPLPQGTVTTLARPSPAQSSERRSAPRPAVTVEEPLGSTPPARERPSTPRAPAPTSMDLAEAGLSPGPRRWPWAVGALLLVGVAVAGWQYQAASSAPDVAPAVVVPVPPVVVDAGTAPIVEAVDPVRLQPPEAVASDAGAVAVRKPPPHPTPKPVAGPPGWLTVSTKDGFAEVFADGKSLGVTPLFRVPLPVGPHLVEAVKDDGHRKRRKVVIASEAEVRWPVDF